MARRSAPPTGSSSAPGLTFAGAAALVPLPARPRRLAPVPVARVRRARGVDARLRRGRPDALSRTRSAARRASARSRPPRARPGMGIVLDIVPNHMAVDDANPYWPIRSGARASSTSTPRPAATGASSTSTTWPACARRTRRCSRRRTGWRSRSCAKGSSTACGSTIPTGSRTRRGYLERLRDGGAAHVWVEKILDPGEPLRDWPVEGTVGYEFLNDVAALFVDPAGEPALTALWEELSGDVAPVRRVGGGGEARAGGHDVRARGRLAAAAVAGRRGARGGARRAARLPHVHPRPAGGRGPARAARGRAASSGWAARRGRSARASSRRRRRSWPRASRTPPSTATCGCSRCATSAATRAASRSTSTTFHAGNAARAERFPRHLLSSQTHDTKRSGDVRARLGALAGHGGRVGGRRAELGGAERAAAGGARRARRGRAVPDLADARRRVADRAGPARAPTWRRRCARPSGRRAGSSRTPTRRRACSRFSRALYDDAGFRAAFEPFAERVAVLGELHALRQTALKLTVPGVPDIYQGDELVALSLVDPDNRRPVDWARRRALLAELRDGARPGLTRRAQAVADARAARAARPPRRRRSPAATRRSTPARTRWRSCAATPSPWRCRCARAGWTRRSRCRGLAPVVRSRAARRARRSTCASG